jgi:ATP-dependent Clp protease ATP-binding subunit ClpC
LGQLAGALYEQHQLRLEVSESVFDLLLERGGFDSELGARPLKRAIARLIEAPLAEKLLTGDLQAGRVVRVTTDRGEIAIHSSSLVSAAE